MAEPKRPRLDEGEVPEGDGLETGDALELENPAEAAAAAYYQALDEADALQARLEKVNDEASDKVLAVEQEYNKKRRPIYTQRNAVFARIPQFWKKVLLFNPTIREIVSEADLDIMDYLTEVDVEDFEDIKSGYKIRFVFAENPYFSNSELTKVLNYSDDAQLAVTGTHILWRHGREPAAYEDDALHPGQKRPLCAGNQYNFFATWFNSLDAHQVSQLGGGDEVGEVLKDEIWPDPLRLYRAADVAAGGLFDGEDEYEDGEYEEEGADVNDVQGEHHGVEGGEAVYVVEEGFEGEAGDDGLEGLGNEGLEGEGYEGIEGEGDDGLQGLVGEDEEGLEGEGGEGLEGEDDEGLEGEEGEGLEGIGE